MRYYRQLAYRLRRRRMPENEIARVLSEVRDLSTASAKAPQEEFGPADDYATTFSEGGTRWTLSRWVNWGARLAGFGFVILNTELRLQGGQMLLPWWAVLGGWFAVLAAGEVARFALDHRLPRAFTTAKVPEPRRSQSGESRQAEKAPRTEGAPAAEDGPGATEPIGYYRTLAFNLRLRHLPEAEVARILEEARELSWACGSTPQAEFGSAQDYAEQFDRRKRRYGLSLVVFLACVLTGFFIQLMNMTADLRGGDRLLPPGLSLLTYAALFVGGASFAVLYEHRLPRGFHKWRLRRHGVGVGE
ncbi:hypothetical protein [Jidongwangia harbinensis]|uniref:hypothetical protein n=1 Tax=Jidongwangia harbinensis TaxID=2878561 RepID=UPI001CD9475D|nr:hypothetical protein [Jidongwangia harbinensis]MCA2215427.1 hypothetical protein [Jidongwangia harbinensis]